MTQLVKLTDHPSSLDPSATLVGGPRYEGRDIYKVRGGYLACLGHDIAIRELFRSFREAQAAQINTLAALNIGLIRRDA